jgi:hypothetical protein
MSEKQRASAPFLQRYLNGEAGAEAIDDDIDAWHEKPGRKKLFDFLGMTREEYALWLCDPDSLSEIARARRSQMPLADVVREALDGSRTAAHPRETQLRRWLAQQAEPHPAK